MDEGEQLVQLLRGWRGPDRQLLQLNQEQCEQLCQLHLLDEPVLAVHVAFAVLGYHHEVKGVLGVGDGGVAQEHVLGEYLVVPRLVQLWYQ